MTSSNEPISPASFWLMLLAVAVIAYAVGRNHGSDIEIGKEAKYGPKSDVGHYAFSYKIDGGVALFFIADTTTGFVKIITTGKDGKIVRSIQFHEPDTP